MLLELCLEGQLESAATFNEMYNFAVSAISKNDSNIKSDDLKYHLNSAIDGYLLQEQSKANVPMDSFFPGYLSRMNDRLRDENGELNIMRKGFEADLKLLNEIRSQSKQVWCEIQSIGLRSLLLPLYSHHFQVTRFYFGRGFY